MAALGLREVVARVDERHQVVELGLLVGKLAGNLLEGAGLHRQLRLADAQSFAGFPFLGGHRLQDDGSLVKLGLEAGNRFAGPADLRELARGLGLHLLDTGLEPARRHGDLRVQLAHIRLDVGHQAGRGGFKTFNGEAPEP
jgi:hypothetical protein